MNSVANETTLTFERVINAPRALVWEAWTDPKHAAQWWGPAGCTTLVFEADLRPGGSFRIDIESDGAVTRIEGVYEEVSQLERLVTVGSLARDGVKFMDSRREVTFEEDGGKTRITLRQTFYNLGAQGSDAVAGTQQGMQEYFDRLEEYLQRTIRR